MTPRRAAGRRAVPAGSPTAGGAFGWSLANTMISKLGTLGIGIVLARVLGPEQFGTFAIALVALMAVLSFNELGVSLAIVRWREHPSSIVPTVNTISVIASTLFCAAAWYAAPTFTRLMGDEGATLVVRLLILSVLVNGVVAAPAALLQRNFQERQRLVIDQVNVWAGAGISVALALLGMGAMALAIGRLAGSAISAVMFLRASPEPYRWGWRQDKAAALLKFGLPLAGTSIIVFCIGYSDQLIAGALLGATALGYYVLAFNLSSWPVSIVSQPLRRVAPAAFAAIQDNPAHLRSSILALFSVLACVTVPVFVVMAAAAAPLVRIVYGEVWLPSAPVMSWLVVSALSKVLCELAYDYIVVIGKTSEVFKIQVIGLIVLIPALAAGALLGGLVGLALAQAMVAFLVMLPLYLLSLRAAGLKLGTMIRRLAMPLASGAVVGAVSLFVVQRITNPWLALLAAGCIGLVAMAGLVYLRKNDVVHVRGLAGAGAKETVK